MKIIKMKMKILIAGLSILMAGFSCSGPTTKQAEAGQKDAQIKEEHKPIEIDYGYPENIELNDSIKAELSAKGMKITSKTRAALINELYKTIWTKGVENAVSFCSERAIQITDSISKTEMVMIKRLAKKYRNPDNAMSDNEANLYKGYVVQYINGQQMNPTIGWDEKGRPVYYQPIFTEKVCLNCHGKPGIDIKPEVMEKLARLYPDDKAIDFKRREIRGMWAITFPEYKVTGVEH